MARTLEGFAESLSKELGREEVFVLFYLESHVGKEIIIKLNNHGASDPTLRAAFSTSSYIINRLLGVDAIGIWLEGFISVRERDGETYENGREEPVSVLIRWEYLEGVFKFEDPAVQSGNIGFNFM